MHHRWYTAALNGSFTYAVYIINAYYYLAFINNWHTVLRMNLHF